MVVNRWANRVDVFAGSGDGSFEETKVRTGDDARSVLSCPKAPRATTRSFGRLRRFDTNDKRPGEVIVQPAAVSGEDEERVDGNDQRPDERHEKQCVRKGVTSDEDTPERELFFVGIDDLRTYEHLPDCLDPRLQESPVDEQEAENVRGDPENENRQRTRGTSHEEEGYRHGES